MPSDLDLEQLLAPISPDAPSGVDLRREQAFDLLQAAMNPGFDYPKGDDGREMQVPRPRDFAKIRREALDLLGRGRDLRVLVVLVQALAATDGPGGLAAGLALVRGNLEAHWETLHPVLDQDETQPAQQAVLRLNALRELAAPQGLLAELRRVRLVEDRKLGAVSWRQWELANGWGSPLPYETKPQQSDLEIVLRSTPAAVAERLADLAAAAGEIRSIEGLLAARIEDAGALPDFEPLAALIERMRALLAPYAPAAAVSPAAEAVEASLNEDTGDMAPPAPTDAAAATGGALPARLDSREDVLRVLDLVVEYYPRREPGSPVPLVVERARRMVPMSFFDVMAELAPDSLARLKDLLGPKE